MQRAIATDYLPYNCWVADERYMYGTTSSPAQTLERIAHGSRTQESTYDWGSGYQVIRLFVTDLDGELFACIKTTATSVHTLWRSTDYGSTWTLVLTHPAANIYLLYRGIAVGYPGGVRTYALCEYFSGTGTQALRILTSTNGVDWTSVASVTGGTVGANIRHWHCIAWNEYNEKWYLGSGDASAESMLMCTADLSLITDAAPATIVATAGISGGSGAQRYRTVEFLFTPNHVFTATDTTSADIEKGIWRWNHELTKGIRVDLGDTRYETGSGRTTMWTGLLAENHLMFCSYPQNEVAGYRHVEIYAAEVGRDGQGQWREIARAYTRMDTTGDVRGLWYAAGKFGFCIGRGAGKQTQNETAIFELQGTFTDDYLGTAPHDGSTLYVQDTIHPVYWVSSVGSDSNDGYSPSAPWATIDKALKGGTGAGAITVTSTSAAASNLSTVVTATAHSYVAGSRVTISGNADSAMNKTWVVYDTADSTHFRVKCPSTITGGAGGTVNDTYSNITYGGKVVIQGDMRVTTSFNVQVDKFPYNNTVSGVTGFSGESGHPIQLATNGTDAGTIIGDSGTSGVAPFTLNTSGDWFIADGITAYTERAASGSRSVYAAAAGAKFWARDSQLGHASYGGEGWRNGASNDGDHYLWRCHIVGDTALAGVNQPGVEVDGTARVLMYGCLVETTYRGVRLRTVGTSVVMAGCTVRNFSQDGISSVAANNTGSFKLFGNVAVSSNGSAAGAAWGTGTFAGGGFAVENNFFERTPTGTATMGASNISAQVTGQPLTYYFDSGDPRNGPAAGSPIIDTGAFGGSHDYALTRRKNPSSRGHVEYGAGERRVTSRRVNG